MGAKSACDLPRNWQQFKNLKYSSKKEQTSSVENCSRMDVLARIMQMCKNHLNLRQDLFAL